MYHFSITKEEEAEFKQIFREVPYQDVNYIPTDFHRNHDPEIFRAFFDPFLKRNSIPIAKRATFMYLVDSVIPHKDQYYCEHEDFKNAHVYIHKTTQLTSRTRYEDSPKESYFYHDNKWEALVTGEFYKFNPKKEHAVLNSQKLQLIVFWR